MYNLTLNCSWVISTILKLHQGNCAWKVLSHCICFKAWLSYVRASPHYRLGRLPAANNEHTRRLEPDLSLITHTEIRKQLSHSSFVDVFFFSRKSDLTSCSVNNTSNWREKRNTPSKFLKWLSSHVPPSPWLETSLGGENSQLCVCIPFLVLWRWN